MNEHGSSSSGEELDAASVARGLRVLRALMLLAILASIAASIAFATGRFDDYPYAWF